MDKINEFFESLCPPDYELLHWHTPGRLIVNGNLQLRYRLLSLPMKDERDGWYCRVATRICYGGQIKYVEEGLFFTGDFLVHFSNVGGSLDVWRLHS